MKRYKNKYKTLLNEMYEVYRCIRSLIVDDNLIEITCIHNQKIMCFVERIKITSHTICSFVGRSHNESN